MRPRILVRRPSPRLADGEVTHLARTPVDPALALRQWEGYVAAFRSRGWAVSEVEAADEHPDGVFVEDTVVVFDDLAVLTRPGVASLQGEVASTARAVDALTSRIIVAAGPPRGRPLNGRRGASVSVSRRRSRCPGR